MIPEHALLMESEFPYALRNISGSDNEVIEYKSLSRDSPTLTIAIHQAAT